MSTSIEQEHSTIVSTAADVQKPNSSWFSLSFNLANQLSNITSSIFQVTSKVGAAANTLVHKALPQGSSIAAENEPNSSTIESKNDLTSIFNDLSSTMVKSAQQLKQVVEDKSFLGHFAKEHDKFLTGKRTQQSREETAAPPWIGCIEEEEMKKQILALPQDKRNFLRNPPPGANYHFDMSAIYPVALATLEVDEHLKRMRFDLVPRQINEETFWRNYFYRVSLIQQATQLTAFTNEQNQIQLIGQQCSSTTEHTRRTSDFQENMSDVPPDFVSEDYDTSAVNMDDIRREIEQLSSNKSNALKAKADGSDFDDSEWDKPLTDELENVSPEELDAQINQMLTENTK